MSADERAKWEPERFFENNHCLSANRATESSNSATFAQENIESMFNNDLLPTGNTDRENY